MAHTSCYLMINVQNATIMIVIHDHGYDRNKQNAPIVTLSNIEPSNLEQHIHLKYQSKTKSIVSKLTH